MYSSAISAHPEGSFVWQANLLGNAALLLLLPAAAAGRSSLLAICACLSGIGLFQVIARLILARRV